MKLFLIVFSLSLLFVIGSAMAMKYFDNAAQNNNDADKNEGAKALRTQDGNAENEH